MCCILGIGGSGGGGDARVEKTAGMCRWQAGAVFSRLCAGKHRQHSDSEKLFPLSKNMKGGIPYSGTLLLSLASEKEG